MRPARLIARLPCRVVAPSARCAHGLHVLVAAARDVHDHDACPSAGAASSRCAHASACDDSSAGRMPSRSRQPLESLERRARHRSTRIPCGPRREPRVLRARPTRSRDPPRPSASAGYSRPRPAARDCACRAARPARRRRTAPRARRARCRGRPPRRRRAARDASSMNASKIPIALLPPPTQATTRSGSRPAAARICARASWPITDWNSRTISGYGCGPSTEPSR